MRDAVRKSHYKIYYRRKDGTHGTYFIASENAHFAVTDFMLRTGQSRESVISVEVQGGRRWVRVL